MKNLKDKKIVMLLASDFSFDSRVLKEATSASQAGMKVTVLARKSGNTKFNETKDGFKIIRVQTWIDRFWAKVSPTKGKEIAGSQSAGTNIPKWLITYAQLANLGLMNRLFVKEVSKIKPDLIHANDAITLPAAYQLKKLGYKVIFDSHEFYSESVVRPSFFWKRYYISLEKKMNTLDGIFSVCQSILHEFHQRYQTKKVPQAILYNAPFYRKIRPKKPDEKIKLLYVGNFISGRNLESLIKMVKNLNNVTLTCMGPGWPKIKEKNVSSLPPVPPEKIVSEISKYDIGLIPYVANCLNHKYATPNKIFEYMMGGLAVAGSDLPEISKIINSAKNGILFNGRDPQDIAAKVRVLIKDREKLYLAKKNSLAFIQDYSWENQAKKQLALYEKVIVDE